jgi:molybdopterin-guanine dinucleotide biosynthesis protein MobB
MRVINVIGHSNSGKTTFISRLVVKLKERGEVATIKHLGHKTYSLEQGKDTTVFFENGVFASVGIDNSKSVITTRENSLTLVLDILADRGIDFAIIEGFKSKEMPSVVIGDLVSGNPILKNPGIDELTGALDNFPEYFTRGSLEKSLTCDWIKYHPGSFTGDEGPGSTGFRGALNEKEGSVAGGERNIPSSGPLTVTLTSLAYVINPENQKYPGLLPGIARQVSNEVSAAKDCLLIGAAFRNWWDFSGPQEVFVSAIAPDADMAFNGARKALLHLKGLAIECDVEISG